MKLLLRSFATFSLASGLRVSPTKSNVYFGGVPERLKEQFISASGFVEGTLSFHYLGLPIQTTRLKKQDCECLVEKICARIHSYGARKFSYAGRLVLVKAVLSSLHSYWASLFVLPKGVISKIENTCRNFLWDSSTEYCRAPLVAWDKICAPKEEGGLGIRNLEWVNVAMVGRLVNWIMIDKESLWVTWVRTNFLKNQEWIHYTPSAYTSWAWRRICKVRDQLAPGFSDGIWTGSPQGYTVSGCYEWIRGQRAAVPWSDVVWNGLGVPKHQFFGWLYMNGALRTNDKLISFGIDIPPECLLCGQEEETNEHLVFGCEYSRKVLRSLLDMADLEIPFTQPVLWRWTCYQSSLQYGIYAAVLMSTLYHIWQQRNLGKHEHLVHLPRKVAANILDEVRLRIRRQDIARFTSDDLEWLRIHNLL